MSPFLHVTFPLTVNFALGFTSQKFPLNVNVGIREASLACHLVLTSCGYRATVRTGQWALLWVLNLLIPAHIVWPCACLPLWLMKGVCWPRKHQRPVASGHRILPYRCWPQDSWAKAYLWHISSMVAKGAETSCVYGSSMQERKLRLTEGLRSWLSY